MRAKALQVAKRLTRREEGASFLEYGLLLVLIVLAVGAAALTLGTDIRGLLNRIGSEVQNVTVPEQQQ
jgi:Flp pilus assembly pilin Flp